MSAEQPQENFNKTSTRRSVKHNSQNLQVRHLQKLADKVEGYSIQLPKHEQLSNLKKVS